MTNEIVIHQEEIDLLDRKKLAKNLLKVIRATNAHVYSINAPWGAGKTKFLSFIKEACDEQQLPYIQLNAWEADYADIPFLAITSELITQLQDVINEKYAENDIKVEIEKLKKPAGVIINLLKRLKFKGNIAYVTPDGQRIEGGIETSLKEETIDLVQEFKNQKNIFKDAVQSVCKILGKDKIIIAIDELDRCHPHYAISALETIKHFFEIDNLVFVLAVDKVQLENTVKTMFGFETNTDAYLKKFVDMQYTIPEPNSIFEFVKDLFENKYPHGKKAVIALLEKESFLFHNVEYNFWEILKINYDTLIRTFCDICIKYQLNLRDIEKLTLKFAIILSILVQEEKCVVHIEFLVQLILTNICDNEFYVKIKNPNTIFSVNDYKDRKYISEKSDFRRIVEALKNKERYDSFNPSSRETWNLYKNLNCIKKYFDLIEFASNLE